MPSSAEHGSVEALAATAHWMCADQVGARWTKKNIQPKRDKPKIKEIKPKSSRARGPVRDMTTSAGKGVKDYPSERSARKSPLYHNAFLEAPDGQPLCTCDVRKAEWYVAKGLGVKIEDEPLRVRLTFEPSGRPEGKAGEYYLSVKDNLCVVCGKEDSYLRKYVVPHEYRKHFPDVMRDHQSHDVLLMCMSCHQRSNLFDFDFRKHLASECNAPIGTEDDIKVTDDFAMRQVRSAARAIDKCRKDLPAERLRELEDVLKNYYGVEHVDEEVLRKGTELHSKQQQKMVGEGFRVDNPNYRPHGQQVVHHYIDSGMGIMTLERRWRQHFLDTMRPQFLPALWLDIRVNENRINMDDYAKAAGTNQT